MNKEDQSDLDSKYFIDADIYNCPFCNRRHVTYENLGCDVFDWSNSKEMRYLAREVCKLQKNFNAPNF
jgi:hypothetical protein